MCCVGRTYNEAGKGLLAAREYLGITGLALRRVSASILPLCSGVAQLAVRGYTVRWPNWPAMVSIVWMPVALVPITATRLPAKSDRLLWRSRGVKRCALEIVMPLDPGQGGCRQWPIAVIRKREMIDCRPPA